jgi:two-component system sensor histidine kinase RegB
VFARWVGSVGQILTAVLAYHFLRIEFNAWGIGACIGFAVLSNMMIHAKMQTIGSRTRWVVLSVLVFDSLILTAMLHWSGGAHNPFTSFYLLHVTLAAVLLPVGYALGISLLSVSGFVWLYLTAESCCGMSTGLLSAGISQDLHFQGMVVSLALTALFISIFVGKIQWELNRSHQLLSQAQTELSTQQRFRSLATLATGVAHELATPLSTIALVSRELESMDTDALPGDFGQDLRMIRAEVERCRSIIDRLHPDNLRQQVNPVSIRTFLERFEALLPEAVASRVRIHADPSLEQRMLPVPDQGLNSVLQSLLHNACDADRSESEVSLRVIAQQDQLWFEVSDCGPGVPPEVVPNLGEPFFTTKEPQQGMGLGLFLARVFAEQWNGSLQILNREPPAQGLVVTLRLPRAAGAAS